jgi:hypothetical protein
MTSTVWTRCGSRRTRRVRSPCGVHTRTGDLRRRPRVPQAPCGLTPGGGGGDDRSPRRSSRGLEQGAEIVDKYVVTRRRRRPCPVYARVAGVAGSPSPPREAPAPTTPPSKLQPPPTRTRTTHRSLARAWSAASPSRACSGGTSRSPRRRSSRGTRRRRRRRSE